MLTSDQIRAARAMLRMEQTTLADLANVSSETIKRLEKMDGEVRANEATIGSIRLALERRGIVFVEENKDSPAAGPGVRLRRDIATEEWNKNLAEVLAAISARARDVDFQDVLEEYLDRDGETRFVRLDNIDEALLKVLDHVGDLLFKQPVDPAAPNLFSMLQQSEEH
ncbi:hypothetical protein HX900_17575 [Rhizobium sp. WYCCWR 11290]|uniref:XRE family transcriptional regulator n=1 Tax=Rhizobium changzhiense TaxID=2692317 RepID=A0A7Z0RLG6_9HYPH|nr:hypothetical protein [Rhizobium changzhiense]NZD62917.1 hypothetical protein [Rhizobium changzhiense]